MKITKKQLRRIIKESLLVENVFTARSKLLNSEYVEDPATSIVKYPYGRNRGDVRSSLSYTRKDGKPISDEDMAVFVAVEENNHPLAGMYTHNLSDDRMTLHVSYYKHTAG